jgi:hypothetical protein
MDLRAEHVADPSDFDRIEQGANRRIQALGEINYAAIKAELRGMQRPVDTFVFNPEALAKEMARVQGYKDRAVEILGLLTENNVVQQHVVETLTKGWMRCSTTSPVAAREGEAVLKMWQFSSSAADAEHNYRYALGIVKNLESQLESLSRQIACIQVAAKIHDARFAFDSSLAMSGDDGGQGRRGDGDRVMDWEKFDT